MGLQVKVFMGSRGGFWYVDKNNENYDLMECAQGLNTGAYPVCGSITTGQHITPPQHAPLPQVYPSQPNYPGCAVTTAAAAGLGAITGAAIDGASSNWNTVPYGAPIHFGAAAGPYYNLDGKPVYIDNSTNTATIKNMNAYHRAAVQQEQKGNGTKSNKLIKKRVLSMNPGANQWPIRL